jgi:hypothetical protein
MSTNMFNFLSLEKFNELVDEYLTSMSHNRREKALISSELSHKIQEILQNPNAKNHHIKLRNWAHYHFTIMNVNDTICVIEKKSLKMICLKDSLYTVIGGMHRELQHAGYRKTHNAVSFFFYMSMSNDGY